MAGGKETPRQKMIGMMYLVLTALLALNISKEVLNGFVKVEKGLIETHKTMREKNKAVVDYLSFRASPDQEPEKAGPYSKAANEVHLLSTELQDYIQELKARTMAASQGGNYETYLVDGICVGLDAPDPSDPEKDLIQRKDEYDAVTNMLYGATGGNPKTGEWTAVELRQKLEDYRDALKNVAVLDAEGNKIYGIAPTLLEGRFDYSELVKEGEKEVEWEQANFYHNPLAAVMPIMSKLIIDVQDAENLVLNKLSENVDGSARSVNKFDATIIPASTVVFKGEPITANVVLAAYDSTFFPNMYLMPWEEDREIDSSDFGEALAQDTTNQAFGTFSYPTDELSYGLHQFQGGIEFPDKNGDLQTLYFEPLNIKVVPNPEPALVVSPTNMLVFYRKLENPVEISVSSVSQDSLSVRIDRGTIRKERNGSYTVIPPAGGSNTCTISVSAQIDGRTAPMGTKTFDLKKVPSPAMTWFGLFSDGPNGQGDLKIQKNSLSGSGYPPLKPTFSTPNREDFNFKIPSSQLKTKSFDLVIYRDGKEFTFKSTGQELTPEMINNLKKLKSGDSFFFDNIYVNLPDGVRQMPAWKVGVK